MDNREKIITQLIARDEDWSFEDAEDAWHRYQKALLENPEHFGDCTKKPQPCIRCHVERLQADADKFLSLIQEEKERLLQRIDSLIRQPSTKSHREYALNFEREWQALKQQKE